MDIVQIGGAIQRPTPDSVTFSGALLRGIDDKVWLNYSLFRTQRKSVHDISI